MTLDLDTIASRHALTTAGVVLGLLVGVVAAEVPAKYRRKKPKSALELLSQGAQAAPTMSAPTTSASTRPAKGGAGAKPFGKARHHPVHALPGVVVYSNGGKVPGYIWTPSGKEWRVYERASKQFRDIPFDVIKQIEGHVEWERMEDDWRWKEGGMDVKVFTGKKYPNRMTYHTFTLLDDRKIVGNIAQMFYVELAGRVTRAMLHKRRQGKIGLTLESMPYVKQVIFDPKAMDAAIKEIAASRPTSKPSRASKPSEPSKPSKAGVTGRK